MLGGVCHHFDVFLDMLRLQLPWPLAPSPLLPGDGFIGAVSLTWVGGWVTSAALELGGGEALVVMYTLCMDSHIPYC